MSISGPSRLEKSIEDFKLSLRPEDHHTLKNFPDPSPEDVAKFVKDLDAKLQQKQKRRKTLQSSPFTTFVQSMQQFSSIVDTCVQSNPEIAALVWGGMKLVLLTFSNYLKYLEEIVDMCDQMGRLCPQFERFSKLFPKHKELQSAICEFYAIIVDFFREALVFLYSSVLKQLAIATFRPFEEKFGGILKSLNLARETIDKEITLSSEQELHIDRINNAQLRTDVRDLCHFTRAHYQYYQDDRIQVSEEARRSKRERILRNISMYPYYSDFTNNLHKRIENSGLWIYDTPEYESWFRSPESNGLWYHAIPGFGKSVLTAGVVDSLLELSRTSRKEKHYVAYFFCTYKTASSLLAYTILSSLLHQMLYYSQDLPRSLLDDLESRFEDRASASRVLLSDIQRFLADIIENNQAHNYIVVDGLDECNDKERGAILRALKKLLGDAPRRVKILISSRGSQDMIRALQNFQQLDLGGSNQNDIEAFISQKLRDKELEGQLPELSGSLLEKVKSFLAENAKGLFIWVDLQIEEICKEARPEDIEAVLPTLPKDLDELYDRVISRIVQLRRPEVARDIFNWVAYAIRPLTLEELKEATSLRDTELKTWEALQKAAAVDESKWLQNCETLVVINKANQTVEFAHSTIKEFLESSKASDPSFHLDGDSHPQLAEACIRYLKFPEITKTETQSQEIAISKQFLNSLAASVSRNTQNDVSWASWVAQKVQKYTPDFTNLPSSSTASTALITNSTVIATQRRTFKSMLRMYPFLRYATSSWAFHHQYYLQWPGLNRFYLAEAKRPEICSLFFQRFDTIRFPWQNYFTPESLTSEEYLFYLLDWALDNKVHFIFELIWRYGIDQPNGRLRDIQIHKFFMKYWLPINPRKDDVWAVVGGLTRLENICHTEGFAGEQIWRHLKEIIQYDFAHNTRDPGGQLSKEPRHLVFLISSACQKSDRLLFDELIQILGLLPTTRRVGRGTKFIISKYFGLYDYVMLTSAAIAAESLEILECLQGDEYQEFVENLPIETKFDLLHSVAKVGKARYFRVLMIRHAGGLNGSDISRQSLIQKVSQIGEVEMVKLCLRYESDMRHRSKTDSLYPIQIAAKHNHLNVIKAMLPFIDRSNVDLAAPRTTDSALTYAIKNQNVEMVRILLDAGANPGLRPERPGGDYPCQQLSLNPNVDIFNLLMEKRRTAFLTTMRDEHLMNQLRANNSSASLAIMESLHNTPV